MSMNGSKPSPCGSKARGRIIGSRSPMISGRCFVGISMPSVVTSTDTAAVWLAQRRGHGVPLSYAAFESALRLLGRKVGATVRAHQFRHTLAQGILETSGNLKVTQALLGHAHLSTTADLYLTVDPRALVDAVAAVKTRSAAAGQARRQGFGETSREHYAFAYDAVTIEEVERAVTATRSPKGERP